MTENEYKRLYEDDDAVGWLEIDKALLSLYDNQNARHYAARLHYMLGGNDPLDGTSIYDSENQEFHRHLISYGMSELYYNEQAAGGEFSKWGFEFTFRLIPFAEDEADPIWAINFMNNLARYVFESKRWFDEYHFMPANGPIRLKSETEIDITGFAFVLDPELGKINTSHGEVAFLQIVGLTSKQIDQIKEDGGTIDSVKKVVEAMRVENPLLITDLTRK